MKNIILNADSYKASHYLQYPEGVTGAYSYIESRGGMYDETLFFGLQGFMKEYLEGKVVTRDGIEEAAEFFEAHGEPFNRKGWEYILSVHKGRLPVRIRAVREGAFIPTGNVLVSIESTDPVCAWLPSYLETSLLRAVWYPTTVATRSARIRRLILSHLERTGAPELIDFKLHDFGKRGASSYESSAIGAAAHLVSFNGTDTVSGVLWAKRNYSAGIAGFSIPASEHSTMTIRGEAGELESFRQMIREFGKPGKMFACVSDGYDIIAACAKWGSLKDELIASGATLVVRPDSGDPVRVSFEVIRELEKFFGSTVNSKGFKVLNTVRVIYGDGINELSIDSILRTLEYAGYSADNIAFGMGGALLQGLDRDTQKFAMKCSAVKFGLGEWIDVFKDPKTDRQKRSKRGRVETIRLSGGTIETVRVDDLLPVGASRMMFDVFENGYCCQTQTFDEVRNLARNC